MVKFFSQSVAFSQHSHCYCLMVAGIANVFIPNTMFGAVFLPSAIFMLAPSGVVPVFVEQDHSAWSDVTGKRCQHCLSAGIQVSVDV
jgi:hypothetical protein